MKPPPPSRQTTLPTTRAEDFVEKPKIRDPRQLDLVKTLARIGKGGRVKPGKLTR